MRLLLYCLAFVSVAVSYGMAHNENECQEGTSGYKASCSEDKVTCPPGLQLGKDGKTCEGKVTCPSGLQLGKDGKTCEGKVTCPSGLQLGKDGKTCVGTVTCPPGLQLGKDGKTCEDIGRVKRCDVGNGGCQHLCVPHLHRPHECQCRPGFVLRKDGKSCRELDPCEVNHGGCMHNCVSKGGRAVCQCYAGFRLLSDMKTCHDVYEDVDEILGILRSARKYDIDRSDFQVGLTLEKYFEMHTKLYPESKVGRLDKHIFRAFDSDNSGRLDFKELLLAAKYNSLFGKSEEKMEWAFKVYDVNGDGTIEPSEMTEILGTIHDLVEPSLTILDPSETPERETREFFAKVDENNDGVLSKDEFFLGCLTDEFICKIFTTNFAEKSA